MTSEINIKSETPKERNQRWERLLNQIANENEAALGDLYDESNRLIYSLVLKILGDISESEEVTLDIYKYVWKNAARFDSSKSNPTTWLVMIARSRSIDKMRLRKNTSEISDSVLNELSDDNVNPEETVFGQETKKIVQDALSELNPKQKKVIELVYFYQFTQSEIAEMLDMPVGSVKSTIRLAKDKLKNTLDPMESAY